MENKPSPPYYAAVVVINSDGQVLLGKRKEDGIWTTPGGSAEPEEHNPAKTAARELFEEAGVVANHLFLQSLPAIETRNGKLCHVFLHVVPVGIRTSSKLDPDQEIGNWKWFHIDEIPSSLADDERRHASVRNGYMKFHGITKSLIETLEKGGKPAQVGETRTYGGKQYQKMGNGEWKAVVHPEEKQLEAEQNKNKVVSLTDKLKSKIAEKKEVSHGEQHVSDLKNQVVVEGQETRSGKPMFTQIEAALSHGYKAEDFREAGNFFYDRAQKMADNIQKLQDTKQKVDPKFEEIKKLNLRMAKQFLGQGNRVDDRQAKTKAAMKKSTIHMGHADAAAINTADFAMEHMHSMQGEWLERFTRVMEGYQYGDEPRMILLDKGDLYLVKVDDGIYTGIFKKIVQVEGGVQEDNAKVRMERMTLPTLVQFCTAKEWIETYRDVTPEAAHIPQLIADLEVPIPAIIIPVESEMDKKLRMMELLAKLMS